TALIVAPLVGAAVVWALPASARRRAREVALGFALVEVGLLVGAFAALNTGEAWRHQLLETHAWIPAFGVSYAVGVDGAGLRPVARGVVPVPGVRLAAWRESGGDAGRTRTYAALVLLRTSFMVAGFAARDVFFFYLLCEAMLIPVYFLIGMFGGAQRR